LMMGAFFEAPPPEPERVDHQVPDWRGPPAGALPGVVALELVLAQTPAIVIYISYLQAYSVGFAFDLIVVTDPSEDQQLDLSAALFDHHHRRGPSSDSTQALASERLRLGVEFADGRKATNTGTSLRAQSPPPGPVMHSGSGGSSGNTANQEQWVWPLPPPGPVTFVCEWPAAEIALIRREIDGDLIRDAAGRARTPFPDQPPPGGRVYGTVHS
jgi:hypothetical protein